MNNIQLHHNIKYKFFDKNDPAKHLHLYIGRNEVSYTIVNANTNTVVWLKSFRLTDTDNFFTFKLAVNDLFEQEDAFKYDYQKISVGLHAAPFTLIPEKYFDAGKLDKYLSFNVPFDGSGRIHYDPIESQAAYLVCGIDYYLLESLDSHFPRYSLTHAATSWLNGLFKEHAHEKISTLSGIFANLQKHYLDIAVVKNGKLQLLNTYYYEVGSDILYYLLNAARQTHADIKTEPTVFLGDITEDYPHYKLCRKFLPNLVLGQRPKQLNYCDELDILPNNYHYNLFCI